MALDRGSAGAGAVVITGAASGIGLATAQRLVRRGYHVLAGVLPGEDDGGLRGVASARLSPIPLDVTDSSSLAAAVETVSGMVGSRGLAGLVNNAGLSMLGPLELLPVALLREQFDVNTIGPIAVTQAFLPLLRQGRGRIVMIGSAVAGLPIPLSGSYSASKVALQALTDVLRSELEPWGIPVVLIAPGLIATPLWERSRERLEELLCTLPPATRELYGPELSGQRTHQERQAARRSSAEVVAVAIEQALTSPRPRRRYVVGLAGRMGDLLRSPLLPEWVRIRIARRVAGLKLRRQ